MASTRRHFLQTTATLAAAAQAAASGQTRTSPNDTIQIALIGSGGMGQSDAKTAASMPGVKLVAACDVYDDRLTRMKEVYGKDTFTTRDYREILNRKDIDAVIIATPDHWHSRISIDALNAGKDVYCEKPMVKNVSEGKPVIEAWKKSGRLMQIGSQYVTSVVYQKAKQLIQSGAIGEINMVEAWLDRNTAMGAWQYTIPPDASEQNIDWDRFLGNAPKRPFEPIRLFRWRNYSDYGTALAGDLFVHLLSGLHISTGSRGPTRVFATGGIRYWKDGRDAPDVMLAMMDYPTFNLALRVNFKSSEPDERFGFRFVGNEGTITTSYSSLVLAKVPEETEPGLSIGTFPQALQEQIVRDYRKKYPVGRATADSMKPKSQEVFDAPPGYDSHRDHHRVFWTAVRNRQPVVEDPVFGFRAAGPALLSNTSYFGKKICGWDPEEMREL